MKYKVVLASQSPRRQELLKLLLEEFTIRVSDADESLPDAIHPADAVEALALRKAETVCADSVDELVIGADTVVAIDGMILGKPADAAQAAEMLRRLSGRVHQVYTGVALCTRERKEVFHCCTEVEFSLLSEVEIVWYLQTNEPFDKAGGYGIQGWGARFVKGIEGDYFNVMGLPVHQLYCYLRKIGLYQQDIPQGNAE